MNYLFFLIPVLSAIIGWLGSWIAGKILLFRIIPTQKQSIAEKIGKTVAAEFPFSSIEEKITDPETVKKIMPLVEVHIDDFLRNKLKEKMPMISMFIGDKTVNSLKEIFLKEIEELFPGVLKQFAADLQGKLNLEDLVTNKIMAIRPEQLETALSPALNYFCWAGAVTGVLISIVNMAFFYILN